jgi:multimeric flavodoxin WrbA
MKTLVKVLAVVGSPRKENTYRLIEAAVTAIAAKNVETELVHLADLDIKQCAGCSSFCEEKGECKIQDGMQELYPKLKEADGIIIGTPTYYWNVTGLVKAFVDRTLPLYHAESLKGKMGAAIAVSEENGQELALSAISSFFQLQNMKQGGGIALVRGDKPVGKAELRMGKALGETVASKLVWNSCFV